MLLCEADLTTKNERKKRRYLNNFKEVRLKFKEVEERDHIRNFQPPVSGEEIMEHFGIGPSRVIGEIKEALKEAILEGHIPNEKQAALALMEEVAQKLGLTNNMEFFLRVIADTDDTVLKEVRIKGAASMMNLHEHIFNEFGLNPEKWQVSITAQPTGIRAMNCPCLPWTIICLPWKEPR